MKCVPTFRPGGRAAMAAFGAIALLSLAGCDEGQSSPAAAAPPPPPVTVAKPVVKEIVEQDEFVGRFDATATVEVRARVGGYLSSVGFRDGTMVKEGDLLFVIDQRPYSAALARAEASVGSARARVDFTRQDLARAESLVRSGSSTVRSLDERREQSVSAQADLNGAQAAVRQARLDLEFTEIRAPISGRISRKLVTEGNLVTANETLLTTIVALDPIYFYFDVDERSYLAYSRMSRAGSRPSSRETDHEVLVAVADEPRPTRKGRMDFVDNRLDPDSGTMRGRAVLPNPDLFLTPGMFGRIAIPGSGRYRAVLVPDEAIGADLDRRFVYVVADDGAVSQQVIRPGSRQDGYRIVRQGLTGGETIVVNGIQRVQMGGGKVTPQPTTLPPEHAAPR